MYRFHLTRFSVATAILALTAAVVVRAQQPSPAAASPIGKNIQVLKISADQLQPTMQYFTAALGVQCNFCHVANEFEKDDRPAKATARKMIQMVDRFNSGANDITVTCATCHHGRQSPERTPPLAVEMTPADAAAFAARTAQRGQQAGSGAPGATQPAAPASPGSTATPQPSAPSTAQAGATSTAQPGATSPAQPGGPAGRGPARPTETVDQVVSKYLQAMGGQGILQATSRVMKGTATTRDLQSSPIVVQESAAGGYRIDTETKSAPIIRASLDKTTWVQAFGNVHDLDGFSAAFATRLADFTLPMRIRQRYSSLTVGRYGNIDGVDTIGLQGRVDDNVVEQLQFGRDSGLLLRRTIQTRTPYGALLEQIDDSDYREVSGVKVPFQVRYATWNQVTTEKFSDVQINAPVDPAVFAKPAGK